MPLAAFNRMRRIKAEKEKELAASFFEDADKVNDQLDETPFLKDLTVTQLKAKAKELGLTGYSKMNEAELIHLIESSDVK